MNDFYKNQFQGIFPMHIMPSRQVSTTAYGTLAAFNLDSSSDAIAVPQWIPDCTIDYIEVRLVAGTEADDFRCRIVEMGTAANYYEPTTTLAHVDADETITAGDSAEWVKFDFSNFTINEGCYYLLFDADSGGSFAVKLAYSADHNRNNSNPIFGGTDRSRYWDGVDWKQYLSSWGEPWIRIKTTDGFLITPDGSVPLVTYGSVGTSTNPAYVGNEISAPFKGTITAFAFNYGGGVFFAGEAVISKNNVVQCRAPLDYYGSNTHYVLNQFRIDPFDVEEGDTIRIYYKALAGSHYITLYEFDLSEDNNLGQCLGVPTTGDCKKCSAHTPLEEGGVETWTLDDDAIMQAAIIYGAPTESEGSGGGSVETTRITCA